jgi:hypothetical protein
VHHGKNCALMSQMGPQAAVSNRSKAAFLFDQFVSPNEKR